MHPEPATKHPSEAQTQARQEAAQRLAANTTLTLRRKTPYAMDKLPTNLTDSPRATVRRS